MRIKEVRLAKFIKSQWIWLGFLMLILFIISTGCGNISEGKELLEPTPTELENPEIPFKQKEMLSRVIEDCDIGAQESALIPDLTPNWSTLPINACYQLWMQIKEDPREYDGRTLVTYTNAIEQPLTDLVFRMYPNAERIYGGSLEVNSARVAGKTLQPEIFQSDNTGLRLNLDEPIQPGETVVVELEFTGRLTDGFENSPGTYGLFNHSGGDGVSTYINWYPILALREGADWLAEPVVGIGDAVVSEVGFYLVEVSVPADVQVITSGSLVYQESLEELEVYHFASGPVRDFAVVASPNFIMVQDEVDGVIIQHWGLPGGETRWDEAIKASGDSLRVFNQLFGPYPYRELDIVVAPLQLASGVEYPGLFLMRNDLYSDNPERSYLLTTIVSHETAHQWWYGLVGNDVIENPWQDEALTTYSSLLYLEQFQPQVHEGTLDFFEEAAENQSNSDIGQPVSAFTEQPENYSPVVYSKGAVFFSELRKEIGDEAFFAALRNYFATNLYKIASPESLLDEFEKSCRCELDVFYGGWGVQ